MTVNDSAITLDPDDAPAGRIKFHRALVEEASVALANHLDSYMDGFTDEARRQFSKLILMIVQEMVAENQADDAEGTP